MLTGLLVLFCFRPRKKAKSNKVHKILGRKKGDKYTLKTAFSEDAISGHVLRVNFSSHVTGEQVPYTLHPLLHHYSSLSASGNGQFHKAVLVALCILTSPGRSC